MPPQKALFLFSVVSLCAEGKVLLSGNNSTDRSAVHSYEDVTRILIKL